MEFSEKLNRYISEIDCSAKDLAKASEISTAAISRYRKGERVPDPDGKQLRMLANGIAKLSGGTLEAQHVHDELATTISGISVDYDTFLSNLNALLGALPASNNEIARALNFDPSYISRILTGQRRPADMRAFIAGISRFAARRCTSPLPAPILSLTGTDWSAIPDDSTRESAIASWLSTNYAPARNPIDGFLEKLDTFNLDDFIRAIHFDEMKVPTVPIQLPTTKTYRGIHEMMACELDYLRATVMSKSSADVIMYSEMPLQEMAADPEFPKKWMYGMALLLKKGLKLHIIHDTDRPLSEMMLGLESWIPMYMTGQITPHYFPSGTSRVFLHHLKVSGTVALQGEAIAGYQAEGRYLLTKNRDEVRYFRKRAERMLSKSLPLMRVITAENASDLDAFYQEESLISGRQRVIMGTLPIATIPPGLLERVLERNEIPEEERKAIRNRAASAARNFEQMLATNDIRIEAPAFPTEEFAEYPPALELAGMFREESIPYSREEYAEHLRALREIANANDQLTLVIDENAPFRNIQITVFEGRCVLVSKNVSPTIHFIIEHPDMVTAFERFTAPILEHDDEGTLQKR